MSTLETPQGSAAPWVVNRRVFLGSAAAASAVSLLPLPATAAAAPAAAAPLLGDWTIDDMWGVYPRYADAIAYGRPADVDVAVDPIDAQLVG